MSDNEETFSNKKFASREQELKYCKEISNEGRATVEEKDVPDLDMSEDEFAVEALENL